MAVVALVVWALVVSVASSLSGCKTPPSATADAGVSSSSGGGTYDGGEAESEADEGSTDGGSPSPFTPAPGVGAAYILVSDSDGTAPGSGTSVTLLFEPDGKALIQAVNASAMLSHHGSWSYASGQMTLAFGASDFHPSATFSLNLTASQVTMPFQVFSITAGSSTWTQAVTELASASFIAGFGVASDPDGPPCYTVEQVVGEVASFLSGMTGLTPVASGGAMWPPATPDFGDSGACNPSSGGMVGEDDAGDAGDAEVGEDAEASAGASGASGAVRRAERGMERFGVARPAASASSSAGASPVRVLSGGTPPPQPVDITVTKSSVVLDYGDFAGAAGDQKVTLTPFPFVGGAGATYSIGYDGTDPRTDLIPQSPHDGAYDPPNKTALIIAPVSTQTTVSFRAMDPTAKVFQTTTTYGNLDGPLGASRESQIKSNFADAGYQVVTLDDTDAGVAQITQAFVQLDNPGVVEIFTHGDEQGNLVTGDFIDRYETSPAPIQTPTFVLQKYDDTYVPALAMALSTALGAPVAKDVAYVITGGNPQGVPVYDASNGMIGVAYYAALAPDYWTWLASQNKLDLSSSLVYVGACLTDSSPDLRNAIGSSAYIAFNDLVSADDVADVGEYLSALLGRPTFSAEEGFYNAFRVAHTQTMLFDADTLFQQVDTADDPQSEPADDFSSRITGYGRASQGSPTIAYYGNGWLSTSAGQPTLDEAQIWVLTWAGRWGENAQTGASSLVTCYQDFWSNDNLGGIGAPFCQNANDGNDPTESEVGYATYLLTGTDSLSFAGTTVPRWTLNDGR